MSWWLDNDIPFSAQEMARMSFEASLYGGLWALGLAGKPTASPEDSRD